MNLVQTKDVSGISEYVRAMERLLRVIQDLSASRDLNTVMDIVRHSARDLTGSDGATFVLRDGDLCYYAEEDAISPLWKGHRFPMKICISGWVMMHKEPTIIEDIYTDDRIPVDVYCIYRLNSGIFLDKPKIAHFPNMFSKRITWLP